MGPYLWCANLVLKGQEANSQRPAPERPVVQEGAGLRVCGAERLHPLRLAAIGAVLTSVSEPAVLSSEARYATLTHPEVRRKMRRVKRNKYLNTVCTVCHNIQYHRSKKQNLNQLNLGTTQIIV